MQSYIHILIHTYIYTDIHICKNVCNLFQDSRHTDAASRGDQSIESHKKSKNWFPQNARH